MRLEGDWVIAESGQDRLLFDISIPEDRYKVAGDGQWRAYSSCDRYHNDDMIARGVLVRRPVHLCKPEIMRLLKPAPGEDMHFL